MRYLLLSSFFFFLFASCSSSKILVTKDKTPIPFWTQELLDDTKKNDFQITISTPKAKITGIFIVKQINGNWKGSIINEFGIKVFDFESSAEKCKLKNVISFLDKWYIKKEIASDIQFILEIDNPKYSLGAKSTICFSKDSFIVNYNNKKELRRFPNNVVEYENMKRKLTYSFVRIVVNN
jgi:hypothetical protein